MPPPVSQIAYHHTSDIDPDKKVDARPTEILANIAGERAKDAIKGGLVGYTELQRHVLCEVLNSMQVTHRTIITLVTHCDGKPESVDTVMLARLQLEGLYNFCLMMDSRGSMNSLTCPPRSFLRKAGDCAALRRRSG
jgi:hypothetical protein